MKTVTTHRAALLAACAFAVGVSAAPAFAAPASSGVNEHQPPADVSNRQAKEAIADKPVMRSETADYEAAVKACKKLPLSERTTCISEAGNSAKLADKARHEATQGK